MNSIEIKNLVKVYKENNKEKLALKGIDLNIPKGSFFGLLGPNGAGKSTTIDILAGLTIKTSGSVKISGLDLENDFLESRYKIGVVPQELQLDTFFTVGELLNYYAGYYGIIKPQYIIDELLENLHLKDKVNTYTYALSGGMKRRLLVAKALIHQPEIVILDEPTAGVDVELRHQLWNYIRFLNQEKKITIVITTHYLEEAEELCDLLAIMNEGQIIAYDTTKNLMKKNTIKFVELGLENNLDAIPKFLMDFEPQLEGTKLTLKLPEKLKIGDFIKDLASSELPIIDIAFKEPSLEDVFRKLTTKH
ncbi:MAG: ABC transporter ATP-binding protein [Sphingobacteriia bacterium]|nr:ABC transporter ATP-binding protein [Sphingobacteriia bacterium]